MELKQFLLKYTIKQSEFEKTGLVWDELLAIYHDYTSEMNEMKKLANYTEECLIDIEKVHSIKKRIKDPEHLLEKIIRKKLEKPELQIHVDNYKEIITDLIGVRVLHLFKEDWISIHNYIMKKWNIKEAPCANVREGDKGEFITKFKEENCEVKIHPYGYRSVHYLILLPHNKKEITAEIQVRTVFEEAWSEIDHRIRYPYDIENPILMEYLVIFNRLAGSADEMGSFIKFLKQDLDNRKKELEEKNRIISELQMEINSSKLEKEQKDRINSNLERLFIMEATKELKEVFSHDSIMEATKELESIFGNMTISEATKEIQKMIGNLDMDDVAGSLKEMFGEDNFIDDIQSLMSKNPNILLLDSPDQPKQQIKLLGESSTPEEKDDTD